MILEAPNNLLSYDGLGTKVFLAGTIENGKSVDWQNEISKYGDSIGLTMFNPRRKNWNENAKRQEIDEQINWELSHMEKADVIIMNILGDSKSPISLLELGLYARNSSKLIVFCPETFYRFDNVRVTCIKYGIELFVIDDYEANIKHIKRTLLKLSEYGNRN